MHIGYLDRTSLNNKILFFTFLREGLCLPENHLPQELSENEIGQLFMVAEEQTVSGLIVDAILRNNIKIPQNWVFKAVGIETHIKQINHELNDNLKNLVNLPLKGYVVVKGQTIAAFYPNPLIRMSGDIDFLVYNYPEAKELLEKEWRVELPFKLIDREYAFEHSGATYEIHDQLLVFGCRRHQQIWNELMKCPSDYVNIEGRQIPTLAPTINSIYVFVHLFFHFVREGVSLRQFCDWAMVLHHCNNEINRAELEQALLQLDMVKAYKAMGCILVDDLGLPVANFPFKLDDTDRKWHGKILDDIFVGGNFGKLRHQAKNSWKYKLETIRISFRNCLRYFWLCPTEVGGMIPKLVKVNIKVLFK